MDIEKKIWQLYLLITNGEGTDDNVDKQLSKITRYVISLRKNEGTFLRKQQENEKTILRKQQEVAMLTAENTVLKSQLQKLSRQIDAEREAHAQYSRNLWQILEGLSKKGATLHFTR